VVADGAILTIIQYPDWSGAVGDTTDQWYRCDLTGNTACDPVSRRTRSLEMMPTVASALSRRPPTPTRQHLPFRPSSSTSRRPDRRGSYAPDAW
jgi:hypothetical protein